MTAYLFIGCAVLAAISFAGLVAALDRSRRDRGNLTQALARLDAEREANARLVDALEEANARADGYHAAYVQARRNGAEVRARLLVMELEHGKTGELPY